MKKWILAVIAVFIVQAVMEFALHGVCLAGIYQQTAALWRPMEEMKSLSWLMYLSYAVSAVVLTVIYSKGYEPGKPALAQGIRFGVLIGLLMSVPMAMNCYAVMPIPASLSLGWFLGGMTEMVLAGVVLGVIWK